MVVGMLKVMKQRCHLHLPKLPICLSFTFQTTRKFSRASAWMCCWSFPLCGILPWWMKVLHSKSR